MLNPHCFTHDEILFIKKEIVGLSYAELTKLFNNHFNLSLDVIQLKRKANRLKVQNGFSGRFEPGHIPFNKGQKGWSAAGSEKTRFKKGHKNWKWQPVGTERVNTEGYVEIKIAESDKWERKHCIIYKEANGPIPKESVVIFADKNKLNLDINNLIMVSRKELAVMNHNNLIYPNSEYTKTGKIIADISLLAADRKRKLNKQEKNINENT